MTGLLAWIASTSFSTWLQESPSVWGFPTALAFHTVGMGVLVGASWAVALRLLGFARGIPIGPMRGLFRVMWVGFWVNAASGVVLFISHPVERGTSIVFGFKMLFIVLGMVATSRLGRIFAAAGDGPVTETPATTRLAFASIALWVAAITAGRLVAYIGGNG